MNILETVQKILSYLNVETIIFANICFFNVCINMRFDLWEIISNKTRDLNHFTIQEFYLGKLAVTEILREMYAY